MQLQDMGYEEDTKELWKKYTTELGMKINDCNGDWMDRFTVIYI